MRYWCNAVFVSLRLDVEGLGSCFRGASDAMVAGGSCDACLGLHLEAAWQKDLCKPG
jgi:hypothetical protein